MSEKSYSCEVFYGTSFTDHSGNVKLHPLDSTESANTNRKYGCSESTRKTSLGLVIVVLLAISWVGAQQFAQSAVLSKNFLAPYFTTWFSTCWMTLCFPVFCVFTLISKSKGSFHTTVKRSLQIFGPQNITISQVFTKVFPFTVIWILANYLYVFSLSYIAATDASAISASNVAFVYALSFILLGEKFYIIRIIASCLCISGVVLFGYADGFSGGSNLVPGILMALFSAVCAAVYKVFFKKVIGEGKLGQISLFLSLLGLTNAMIMWIFFLILYFTGVDKMVVEDIPWTYLCGSASLSLVFNFLVNFGIAFTYPLFISVSMMLGIPINAAVDVLLRGEVFSVLRLVAAMLVICGFTLMMCPDSWNVPIHRRSGIMCSRCYGNTSTEDEDFSAFKQLPPLPLSSQVGITAEYATAIQQEESEIQKEIEDKF